MQLPITPPSELVEEWDRYADALNSDPAVYIATQAARWGADAELEACCAWIRSYLHQPNTANALREDRRPKPPSLKQQALEALDSFEGFTGSLEEVDIIRRALESLPDPQD